jgi:sugar-specific transcriptional regulator TrmB
MNKELLEEIGLTKSEINVYLALLELGSSSTGKIVDKSKASSSKIYEILDRLMQKGLVSFIIKSGVKYFEAADPSRIMDYMEEKESKIHKQKQSLKKIIPELELKKTLSKYKSEATVFKGIKGMETAFNDVFKVLKKGDVICTYVVGELDEQMNSFFTRHYQKRAEKDIKTRTIFSEAGRKWYDLRKHIKNFEGKVVISQATSPATIVVYKNKTIIRMGNSDNLLNIMIENEFCAKSFLQQFEELWNQETVVLRGIEGIKDNFMNMLGELEEGDEYYAMGASWFGQTKEMFDFFKEFHQKRIKKKVKVKLLFVAGTEKIIKKHRANYETMGEVKFLPKGIYEGIQFNLYKDKVAFNIWKEREPIVVIIKDPQTFKTFKTYFDMLWNQDTTVSKGWDEFMKLLLNVIDEIKPGGSYDVLGASYANKNLEENYAKVFREMHKKRLEKGINARLLFYRGHQSSIEKHKKEFYEDKDVDIKFLPYETESPVEIIPYGNKTSLVIQEEIPTIITIDNKKITDSFKKHFEVMWAQNKFTKK